MLTQGRLKELLEYDPETGIFRWRFSRGGWIRQGADAGWHHTRGYWKIRLDGEAYFCHRLAWLYVYGQWPSDQLDHINLHRDDNRISNLREATQSQNQWNRPILGVNFHKANRNWTARISVNGNRFFLGSFKNRDEAIAAYKNAASKHPGVFYNF